MAGTSTYTMTTTTEDVTELEINWVADAANGSVPDCVCPAVYGYVVIGLTLPGTPSPTADYDVTVLDADEVPVFGGQLDNRSATVKEQSVPKAGSSYGPRWVSGAMTVQVSGNSVNSASGTVKIFVVK